MAGMARKAQEEEAARKHFDFFVAAIKKSTEMARELHYDKTHKWCMAMVALYGTILEISHAIQTSIESDSAIGTPILLRSQLEACVDFTNLAADRTYGYHLDAANLNEWIKILKEAQKGKNLYLKEIGEMADLDQHLADLDGQLEKLKKAGYLPLKNFQKFERSGLAHEYKSLYNFLCCHSHNNLRALIERHVAILNDGADIELQFFPLVGLSDMLQYFDSAAGILVEATVGIHQAFESPKVAEAMALSDELAEIRKPWTTNPLP